MTCCIDRDVVIDIVRDKCPEILNEISNIPLQDVEPIKHGHWIEKSDLVEDIFGNQDSYYTVYGYKCSVCGKYSDKVSDYCNCGAKMDSGVFSEALDRFLNDNEIM